MANNLIDLKFVELHLGLFLAGVNMGQKLDVTKRSGMKLFYNRREKEVAVIFNNQLAVIPYASVASMTPVCASELGYDLATPAKTESKVAFYPPITSPTAGKLGLAPAQVETPFDHVAQPGPGKTRN